MQCSSFVIRAHQSLHFYNYCTSIVNQNSLLCHCTKEVVYIWQRTGDMTPVNKCLIQVRPWKVHPAGQSVIPL